MTTKRDTQRTKAMIEAVPYLENHILRCKNAIYGKEFGYKRVISAEDFVEYLIDKYIIR